MPAKRRDSDLSQPAETDARGSRSRKARREDQMARGKDYPMHRDPPVFEYDPAKATNAQEGQGQGG